VLQDYIHAVEDAEVRLQRLERQIEELLPSWSMARKRCCQGTWSA
jgi:transposase